MLIISFVCISQFGFRQKLSTSMALLELTDVISKCMESRNFTIDVFLDLAKAFDTVDHAILLNKLSHYGVRGTSNDWFRSYLANRQHIRNQRICHLPNSGNMLNTF